jgi:hypothetical protein
MVRSWGLALACVALIGCGNSAAQQRLDELRGTYNTLLEGDFPASLHSGEADRVLDRLDRFSGPEAVLAQARDLAEQIRLDRGRNPLLVAGADALTLAATGADLSAVPRSAREAVWVSAVAVGATRLEFERFWFPCFRPLDDGETVWTRTGISACTKRLGYDAIQEVHFSDDVISRVVVRELPGD